MTDSYDMRVAGHTPDGKTSLYDGRVWIGGVKQPGKIGNH